MPEAMNRHYKALELDKVLRRLSDFASSAHAKQAALDLEPRTDILEAGALASQTCDAHMLLARFGGPSFGGLIDIGNAALADQKLKAKDAELVTELVATQQFNRLAQKLGVKVIHCSERDTQPIVNTGTLYT